MKFMFELNTPIRITKIPETAVSTDGINARKNKD